MVINCDTEKTEREKLDFDSLPEFIREPYTSVKNSYTTAPARSERFYERYREDDSQLVKPNEYAASYPPTYGESSLGTKSAELETLWPGHHQNDMHHNEFLPPAKRSASMYLTVGFMAGAVVSLIVVWAISLFNHAEAPTVAQSTPSTPASKKIVVATTTNRAATPAPAVAPKLPTIALPTISVSKPTTPAVAQKPAEDVIPELIIPTQATYTVQNGDTLAGIVYKTYKRVSPRLLDTICKHNGMRSADVLELGQTLKLPHYRPIRIQVATRANSNM
ncbi:MAG: LysM peptidoglycan-binding domain-containing protein [Candidatus Obscuribacterales bacterium]|nr:LysM peptidoglycan-binding domain-containing protein [Candidatus Obscuribacterales bacterium]